MPSTSSDFSVNVNDVLYVDRWGISTLTTFNTNLNVQVWNQSPRPIYVKAVINDSSGNWKFEDDTTTRQLGEVKGFNYATFKATLKRAVPSADVEDEQFTITFEFYKDSSYSTKIDQITKTITVNIVDFHGSPAGWTVNIDDFDDGTAQGWSTSLFSVSDTASVKANGYSMYYYLEGSKTTKTPYISKSISVPSGVSKAALIFYWGAVIYAVNFYASKFRYVRVYVNGTKVYEDHVNANVENTTKTLGWEQVGIDLTPYAGQNITIKIEFEEKLDYSSSSYIKSALDEIILATKS